MVGNGKFLQLSDHGLPEARFRTADHPAPVHAVEIVGRQMDGQKAQPDACIEQYCVPGRISSLQDAVDHAGDQKGGKEGRGVLDQIEEGADQELMIGTSVKAQKDSQRASSVFFIIIYKPFLCGIHKTR